MKAALALSLVPALSLALLLALSLALAPPAADAAEDTNAGDRSRGQALPLEKAAPAIEKIKEVAPPAEVPRGLDIKVHEDHLSVNVKDTAFGDVMAVIANAAGFDVDLSNDVYEMKLSTKFRDTEILRGIRRLISLIAQKNYSIHYGKAGSIKHIEVYGDLASGKRTLPSSRPPGALAPPAIVGPKVTIIKRAEEPVPEEPPEEPEEEKILELEYKEYEHYTLPITGAYTKPTPAICPEAVCIPEGDLPPDNTLLNAPYVPPPTPPLLVP